MNANKLKSIISKIISNKSLLYPLVLLIFISIVTGLLIFINSAENILGDSYRDVYFYLIGGLRFAGYNITGYEYISYLSPLVPFLTSLLFRLGLVTESSIFFVTGLFYIIGTMGMYFLLKLRFNNIISFFGAILYCSLSINLLWAANGTIDIPSVALAILAIYFTVLGTKKNQNYFFIAFPLGVLAFFTKFTGAIVILLMLFYILVVSLKETRNENTWNPLNRIRPYLKKTLVGGILGILVAFPFLIYYYINKIPLAFLTQAEEVAETAKISEPTIIDQLYYFLNLPQIIYSPNHLVSLVILIIMAIGIALLLAKFIIFLKNNSNIKNITKNIDKNITISTITSYGKNTKIAKIFNYLLGIVLIILLVILLSTFSKLSFIYTEGLFFLIMLIFYVLFSKFSKKQFEYDLLMFIWFFSYMIFFSIHIVKVNRYFTAMAPVFVFFGALSLDLILKKIDKPIPAKKLDLNLSESKIQAPTFNLRKLAPKIVPVALILFLIITSFGYLTIDKSMPLVQNEKAASIFLKEYDPNYSSKIIWADRGPVFTWYLQKEVKYTDWRYGSNESSDRFNKEINNENVSYYFALRDIPIPNYKIIASFGDIHIYTKV
ncbi:MAG: glycosyltransferase family 39 protein [Methanobacteriaceae archaeon]